MLSRKLAAVFVLSTFLLSSPAYATMVQDLIPDLLKTNERIKAMGEQKQAADHLIRQSQAGYYPSLDLLSESGYEDITRENGRDSDLTKTYNKLRATQLIWDFGATTGAVAKARNTYKQASFEFETVQQEVILEGMLVCIDLMRNRERLQYVKRSEANIKKQTGFEETRVEKGAGLRSDVLQAKSQLAAAMAQRVEVEGDLAVSRNRFYNVFGRNITDEEIQQLQISSRYRSLVPASLEDAINIARQHNPALRSVHMENAKADNEIVIRKAANYPRLELIGQGKYRYNDDGLEGYRLDGFAGMGLTWNLYHGGGDKAGIEAASADRRLASRQFRQKDRDITEEVQNAWQLLRVAEQKYVILNDQAMLAVQFLELARKERKLGNRSLLEVLSAEVEYFRAMNNAVDAQSEANNAVFGLLKAIGRLQLKTLQEARQPTHTIVIQPVVEKKS